MNRVSSVQREVSPSGNVPFSWEAKPGVSKPSPNESFADKSTLRLPLPPCRSESARFLRQINTKLTPDSSSSSSSSSSRSESARFVDSNIWKTVSPLQRSESGRFIFDESGFHFGSRPFLFQRLRYGKIIDVMNEEDPFFEAYKNCTNSPMRRKTVSEDIDRDNVQPGPRKRSIFSCFSS